MELDNLDQLAASAFDGYLVRKDLVRRYSRQYPVPTYVVEFLLGRYCATVDEQEIEEGLQIVERQLQDRTVRTSDQELFKAIDTIDNAFKFCTDHVNAKHNVEYEGDLDHGKGWAFVKNEWHRVLTRLASLPLGLVLISHATDKQIETRTGKYSKTQPSLPDRARHVVLGLVDMILYCDTVSRPRANSSGGGTSGGGTSGGSKGSEIVRIIRTKPHPTYEAGDRTGRLPEVMPLDFAAFASHFATPGKPDAAASAAQPQPSSKE
jgi:hypothetical protein